MADTIRIVVADDTDETRELVGRYLEFNDQFEFVGEAANGKEVIEKIKELSPDIVLMDINMPEMNGLEATEYISNHFPRVAVIIMSVQAEMDYLKKAMVSGAKDYIVKPFTIDVLTETILNTYEKGKKRATYVQPDATGGLGAVESVDESEVCAFFSSKGGVGKSVVATNLAITLSKMTKAKVALLDFDLQFGDIGMILNLKPKLTITELTDENMTGDADSIKTYMVPVTENLDILLAPKKPEYAEYIAEKHIKDIIKSLRTKYRYIIADTATNFEDTTLAVLDSADRIYYVATMDLLAIKNTKLGLDVMSSLRYSQDKVNVVINRNVKLGIKTADVEKILNYKIETEIPDEPKVLLQSVNQGVPVVQDNKSKNSKFAKAIQKMASRLVNQ